MTDLGSAWIYVLEFCSAATFANLLCVSKLFSKFSPPIVDYPIHPKFQNKILRVACSNLLKRCFVCKKKTKVTLDLIPIHLCKRCRGSQDLIKTISPTQAKQTFGLNSADLENIPKQSYWNNTYGQTCRIMLLIDVYEKAIQRGDKFT